MTLAISEGVAPVKRMHDAVKSVVNSLENYFVQTSMLPEDIIKIWSSLLNFVLMFSIVAQN